MHLHAILGHRVTSLCGGEPSASGSLNQSDQYSALL